MFWKLFSIIQACLFLLKNVELNFTLERQSKKCFFSVLWKKNSLLIRKELRISVNAWAIGIFLTILFGNIHKTAQYQKYQAKKECPKSCPNLTYL